MPVREPLRVGYWAGAWEDRVDLAVCSCYLFQRDHSLIRWPPRVPQAPTTQGVEPDFFFWRAAGARRCSRAGRLREAGSQLVQHHAPWRNLTSKHLDAGASHMRCTRCKVQPGAPTTVMHQGAGAHRW